MYFNPLPHMPILGTSNSTAKEDMSKNMDILSDIEENTEGKEEIAHHEQFLLFPQCFQKLSVVDMSK